MSRLGDFCYISTTLRAVVDFFQILQLNHFSDVVGSGIDLLVASRKTFCFEMYAHGLGFMICHILNIGTILLMRAVHDSLLVFVEFAGH